MGLKWRKRGGLTPISGNLVGDFLLLSHLAKNYYFKLIRKQPRSGGRDHGGSRRRRRGPVRARKRFSSLFQAFYV